MTVKIKLTQNSVNGLAAPEAGQMIVWDRDMRGFGVRVTAGGTKTYIVEGRVGRKTRRISLGRADILSAEKARRDAKSQIGKLAEGVDPVAEKARRDARSITVKQAFLNYIAAPKTKGAGHGTPKKAVTIQDIEKAMKRFADWYALPVSEVTGAMVKDRHALLAKTSPAQANLAFRYLRAAINHAMADDDPDNPVIKRNPVDRLNSRGQNLWVEVKRSKRHIPDDKISAWLNAVQNGLIGIGFDNEKRDVLIFMLLTGARLSEVLGNTKAGYSPLKWSDVNFEKRTVLFRDTKNRTDHELPLSTQILELLNQRKAIAGMTYVFGNDKDDVPPDLRTAYQRIKITSGVYVTAHDLRRTFITIASRLDISSYKLKRLINHISGEDRGEDTTAGYVQITTDDLRDAMQRISDYITSPDRRLTDKGLE